MTTKISNPQEYRQVMDQVEVYLQKATDGGGFFSLTPEEGEALQQLSLQVQAYEADLGPMPFSEPSLA